MKRTKDDIITDIVDLQSAVNLALRSAANSDFHLVDNHMLDVTKAVHKVEIDLDLRMSFTGCLCLYHRRRYADEHK